MADFLWGQGGARMTPEDIAAQRKYANSLMASGMDFSPVQSPWQGAARMAQALLGGWNSGDADSASRQNSTDSAARIAAAIAASQGGATPAATPTTGVPAASPVALAPVGGPLVPDDANAVPGTVGMNQRLADLSQDFIDDNPGTSLSSGVRSTADQARLYAERGSNPNPVAFPGTSKHERGQAIDIGGMSPVARALLPQYGLAQPVANDPPHVELAPQTAAVDPAALPPNAQEAQGYVIPGQPSAPVAAVAQKPIPKAILDLATSVYGSDSDRKMGALLLQNHLEAQQKANDPLRQLQIQEAQSKLTPLGAPTKDADGNLIQRDPLGKVTVLNAADKAPTSVSEYKYYKDNFQPTADQQKPMDYQTWATTKARAGAMNVNTNIGGGSDKQIFDTFSENTKEARAAATGLTALRTARQALQGPGGAITGFGADEKLTFQKLGAALGVTDPSAIQNTETFRAAIAPQVAATLKSTVGTANISNSDREFAEKAAGGSIKLDAGSINRLLDIMERAGQARLELHQQQLDAVYPDAQANRRERALFGVQMPTAPQQAAQPDKAAPAASGAIAVNPKTGQRIMLQNGQWVPLT